MAPCRQREAGFRLRAYACQMASTAVFFLMAMAVSPALWLLFRLSAGTLPPRAGQRLLRRGFRAYTRCMRITGSLDLQVEGLEALQEARGTIFVANHPALLDAVILLSRLPPAACVMRASLRRNPALAGGALAAGYVTNDSGPAFVRQGLAKIAAGENLLIFPEGTRTVCRPVNRFKNGFALVAARSGAPVQAVLIDYRGTHLRKGVPLLATAQIPLRFAIRAGREFRPLPGESAPDFSARIERWFRASLEARDV